MINIQTKKELGQHWLFDDGVLSEMSRSICAQPGDTVLEVGPGLGTLTAKLVESGAMVVAVEFDAVLARELHKSVSERVGRDLGDELVVVEQDILRFDLRTLPAGYKVAANIPYYLTSQLIRLLGEAVNPPSHVALLIQKEVAERVCAGPGEMSVLAVTTQFFFECQLGSMVPAELFTPPPKVDSQILILARRERPLFDIDARAFFRAVKAGFGEKRKTLRNSLSGGLHLPKEQVEACLAGAGLHPNARAQELSLQQWKTLFDRL